MSSQNFQKIYNEVKFLSRTHASYRSKQVEGLINYKILFFVQQNAKSFRVYEEVTFQLKKDAFQGDNQDSDFFTIDYTSQIVPEFLKINGQEIAYNEIKENWTGNFLNLNKQHLLPGQQNTLIFQLENDFVKDGYGLYNYIDVDGKQYSYTHLEPNFGHYVFPNFDQPDLKATFEISIVSPSHWNDIANGKIQQITQNATFKDINTQIQPQIAFPEQGQNPFLQNHKLTVFEKTVQFSTYIFFIATGDFGYVELEESKCYKKIPQRIYVRESLKGHLSTIQNQIFEIINKLIPFYESFFHTEFPWSKYDHIFCPDFNINAMENVGAVSFSDTLIPRGPQTLYKFSNLMNIFAHELVHTWFGDLVTMVWWDDLWLKESFADSLSYYAINQIEKDLSFPITNQYIIFNTRKQWGINTDSRNSTHPIAGKVENTEQAKSIFDGITYAKGAATLKQLMFLVGADTFSKAMGSYCKKYSFSVATFQNFIDCLQEQFQHPDLTLETWKDQWLQQPGLNQISTNFSPDNKNNELVITQSVVLPNFPTLRYHKINVGFFKQDGSVDVQSILLNPTSENILKYDASQNYKAVLLNYDDEDFVKSTLDSNSLNYFLENFEKVTRQLDQKLIVLGISELVHDGIIKQEIFANFIKKHLLNSVSDEVFEMCLNSFIECQNLYTPKQISQGFAQNVIEVLIQYLQDNQQISNSKSVVTKNSIIQLSDKTNFEFLLTWFNGENQKMANHPFSVTDQWDFVVMAHKQPEEVFSLAQKNQLFEKQKSNDNSDTVMYKNNTCQSILDILGNDQQKQQDRWNTYLNQSESKYLLTASLQGFNQTQQIQNIEKYYGLYFNTDLLKIFQNCSVANADQFAQHMFPKTQNFEEIMQRVEKLIKEVPENQLTLLRFLSDKKDLLNKQIYVFAQYK